jgi:Cu/Ag efflux protein CusF
MTQTRRIAAFVLAITIVLGGIALAAEIEGKIQAVDKMSKELILDNGPKLAWDEDTKIMVEGKEGRLEDLKEGGKVKASFEEKDGKNIATMLEVSE